MDFTRPEAVLGNAERCRPRRAAGGGHDRSDAAELDRMARDGGHPCFFAPNFALGAVLMMRFGGGLGVVPAGRDRRVARRHEKRDAPSGTARATAERMAGDVAIHSVRLPGLVAHQEVILGGLGDPHDPARHDLKVRYSCRAYSAIECGASRRA